jgi:hypothetical protein
MDDLYENKRVGPSFFWWVVVSVNALLITTFFLPWVSLATPDEQRSNAAWITSGINAVRDCRAVQDLLNRLGVDLQRRFTWTSIVDHEGWAELRSTLFSGQRLTGWWLLNASEPSLWLRIVVGMEILLILLGCMWCLQSAITTNFSLERGLAISIVGAAGLVTLLLIFTLPRMDTLGHRDSFGLTLLMAIGEARPGWGFWLVLLFNLVLMGIMLGYFQGGEHAWKRTSPPQYPTP